MSQDQPSRKRVSVESTGACFVVLIDSQPVLRCAAHRDALRYAVIVRRALEGANRFRPNGASRVRTHSPAVKRQISPTHHIHH